MEWHVVNFEFTGIYTHPINSKFTTWKEERFWFKCVKYLMRSFVNIFFNCTLPLTISALIPFLNRHGAQLWRNMHKGMQKHAKETTPVRSTGSTSPVIRSHVAGLVKMDGVAIDVCIYNKIFDFKRKKPLRYSYSNHFQKQSIYKLDRDFVFLFQSLSCGGYTSI